MNTDYEKGGFRKFQKFPIVVTLSTFAALHSRIVCCPDCMLFYIHEKSLYILIYGHFPYVLT